jgi:hypothetical protein
MINDYTDMTRSIVSRLKNKNGGNNDKVETVYTGAALCKALTSPC